MDFWMNDEVTFIYGVLNEIDVSLRYILLDDKDNDPNACFASL